MKRKLNVKKKAFLTEQVNALILHETPQKFGDPGSPNIYIMIGESRIGRALLDLGSSVNLLPFSMYEQLGLGELKKTTIMLQLADRSVKVPRGIVEDVLVQVDKFYYLVDFVVLDMQQPASTIYQAHVILGRPFLATSNTLINCRSGVLKLTFGNMTLEMNVFNACKIPAHFDDTSDLNVVEGLTPTEFICSTFPFSDDDSIFQTPELLLDKKTDHVDENVLEVLDCFAYSSLPLKYNLQAQDGNPSLKLYHHQTYLNLQRKKFSSWN